LGHFLLSAVSRTDAEPQWQLQPTRKLLSRELLGLKRSKGPWTLYEILPNEDPDFLAQQKAEKEGLTPDKDNPDKQMDPKKDAKNFVDQLCDYNTLFEEFYRQTFVTTDRINSAEADLKAVEAAKTAADQQIEQVKKDVADLNVELTKFKRERDAVAAHHQAVKAKLSAMQSAVELTAKANAALAAEIARLQLQAARMIDQRTKRMAQLGIEK
jgi:predicted ribosome quality control (RQC) complex YloA/Tae2 family protein